jgi:hypothetical protein
MNDFSPHLFTPNAHGYTAERKLDPWKNFVGKESNGPIVTGFAQASIVPDYVIAERRDVVKKANRFDSAFISSVQRRLNMGASQYPPSVYKRRYHQKNVETHRALPILGANKTELIFQRLDEDRKGNSMDKLQQEFEMRARAKRQGLMDSIRNPKYSTLPQIPVHSAISLGKPQKVERLQQGPEVEYNNTGKITFRNKGNYNPRFLPPIVDAQDKSLPTGGFRRIFKPNVPVNSRELEEDNENTLPSGGFAPVERNVNFTLNAPIYAKTLAQDDSHTKPAVSRGLLSLLPARGRQPGYKKTNLPPTRQIQEPEKPRLNPHVVRSRLRIFRQPPNPVQEIGHVVSL